MGHDKEDQTTESNSTVDTHAKKVIPYKEYVAHREAERRASTASKSASVEEENWDEESPCHLEKLHQELNLWMVNQDLHSGSVAGNSGHDTITAAGKEEPIDNIKELIGAVRGVNKSVTTEHLLDVKWRDDNQP